MEFLGNVKQLCIVLQLEMTAHIREALGHAECSCLEFPGLLFLSLVQSAKNKNMIAQQNVIAKC